MADSKDNKKDNTAKDEKVNPDLIVNNPAMQASGRSTDYQNIRDNTQNQGGAQANSREGMAGNYKKPDDEKDRNKAGHVRDQSDDMVNAQENVDFSARPVKENAGKEGKTMVKNSTETELTENTDEAKPKEKK